MRAFTRPKSVVMGAAAVADLRLPDTAQAASQHARQQGEILLMASSGRRSPSLTISMDGLNPLARTRPYVVHGSLNWRSPATPLIHIGAFDGAPMENGPRLMHCRANRDAASQGPKMPARLSGRKQPPTVFWPAGDLRWTPFGASRSFPLPLGHDQILAPYRSSSTNDSASTANSGSLQHASPGFLPACPAEAFTSFEQRQLAQQPPHSDLSAC
ncbi:hypothetical protein EV126DRAFT_61711 [Verticillium dahliae]|nr:hypothetical protein EV126DRAFT_61711 [Verticillium dahliae]